MIVARDLILHVMVGILICVQALFSDDAAARCELTIDTADEEVEELGGDGWVESTTELHLYLVVYDATIYFTIGIGSDEPLRA